MHTLFNILGADFSDKLLEWSNTIQQTFMSFGAVGKIILVLLIIWLGKIAAKLIGKGVEKALDKTDLDDKIAAKLGHQTNVSKAIGGFVFAFVMLFVLIFALDMAKLETVGGSLQETFNDIFQFVIRLALAGVFAYVILEIAKIIKGLVTGVMFAANVDSRLGAATGATPITNAVATSIYCFFILLFTPAILNVLGIEAVSEPIRGIVNQITDVVPNIIGAGLLIFIGLMIANICRELVTNLLKATNVDSFPAKIGLSVPAEGKKSVSSVVGLIVMICITVLIVTAAIAQIEVGILTEAAYVFRDGFFGVLFAVIIMGVGLLAARFAYDNLVEGNATLAKAAKYVIIVLSAVIALDRSGLAPDLTGLPYTVAIYALGVAFGIGGAIALGLGGREFVSRWLSKRG